MNRYIGIFDSGFGGLTVMKAIRNLLPHENILYFGDTARLPYGTKSRETILNYAMENAAFLVEQGVKVLVVACNTACCFALEDLQKKFDVPVIGVTTPTIAKVASSSRGSIAILGTRGTILSETYQTGILQRLPLAKIISIPCQLLVPLVEEGYIDHLITQMAIEEYLEPLKYSEIDTLILGCTHFPLLQHQFQKVVQPGVKLVDPAESCAQAVKELLFSENLANPSNETPHYQFVVSDDPERFRNLGAVFLESPLDTVIELKKRVNFFYRPDYILTFGGNTHDPQEKNFIDRG